MKQQRDALANAVLDHLVYAVTDLDRAVEDLVSGYGFDVAAVRADGRASSALLVRDDIRLVVIQGRADDHPATVFVSRHGDGIADIALAVTDLRAAMESALQGGASPSGPRTEEDGCATAAVRGFAGDVVHTFVERAAGIPAGHLPGFRASAVLQARSTAPDSGLLEVDHLAVCLEAGELEPTVRFYQEVFGFGRAFAERIEIGGQAMESTVVRSRSGTVTLTLIEPDTQRDPGQIDEFVKNHGGAGVQHVAFRSADVVRSVRTMRDSGVRFLAAPPAYFDVLRARLDLARHSVKELRETDVLADEDHAGQLYQIFTRSTHSRGTLFFEVIERCGADTFGSGNIHALYEAVEVERSR